jgi:formamidopyrimidine-DNA glycosylase
MLELPEVIALSGQLNSTIKGKVVKDAVAAASPHKFAWYYGDPAEYGERLRGRAIGEAAGFGGRLEIFIEGAALSFADGAVLRYYEPGAILPVKHQLLVTFEDGSALAFTIAMYGGIWAYPMGALDEDGFYMAAKRAVKPLSDDFDFDYFLTLFDGKGQKMSAKAFLATEQRIPGLGNGVLQDILLAAKINPRKRANTFTDEQRRRLFDNVKAVLSAMTEAGGRDTERDIFGRPGGYKTKLSRHNTLLICPDCGGSVKKEAYMGGSVYYCEVCQEK